MNKEMRLDRVAQRVGTGVCVCSCMSDVYNVTARGPITVILVSVVGLKLHMQQTCGALESLEDS